MFVICMNLFKKRTKIILQDYRNDRKYKNVGTYFCTAILCFNLKVFFEAKLSQHAILIQNPEQNDKTKNSRRDGGGYIRIC